MYSIHVLAELGPLLLTTALTRYTEEVYLGKD